MQYTVIIIIVGIDIIDFTETLGNSGIVSSNIYL